jgi:hypothetical protein
LQLVKVTSLDPFARYELYKRLALSEETARTVGYLSPEDVRRLAIFLKTLSF